MNSRSIDPDRLTFLRDVIGGLSRRPKTIPCKYFYDTRGSELFDRITELEEYYPTRAELDILDVHGDEIASTIGRGAAIIELGSGSSLKTRFLLDHLSAPAAYVPVDISEAHLMSAAEALRADYPHIPILPVSADYSREVTLPDLPPHQRKVAFFPGSTVGNFEPDEAAAFLTRIANLVGDEGGLLIGVDLPKSRTVLERAYNDAEGVTAEFNLNLLHRINAELDGAIDTAQFEHRAVWREDLSCIESSIVSGVEQEVTVGGHRFELEAGEAIRTERSYKYAVDDFLALARQAGFQGLDHWADAEGLFSVHYLETA